jgi:hypothetical protein
MPDNKKHHFVPKFYLRKFSADEKSIGIFNIASRRMVSGGNLGNQCYRDYFYGKDSAVEKALGGMEDSAAIVISKMILNSGSAPAPLSTEHLILAHFMVLQASRTGYEAEAQAEAADKMFDLVYREQEGKPDENQFGFDDSILLSLGVAARAVPVMYDLKLKLLRNETDVHFITSDNPIIRHNQLFEGNPHSGHTGWAQAGLQVFLPLSPKYLCVFYDGQTYKVGDKNARITPVASSEEVARLNALQWLNAHENIYFADGQEQFVAAQAPNIIPRRRNDKSAVVEREVYTPKAERDPDRQRSMLHEFRPPLNVRLKVGCMKVRRHPKHPRHAFRAAPPRDREYLALVEEFDRLRDAKKAVPEDFLAFRARHYASARSRS